MEETESQESSQDQEPSIKDEAKELKKWLSEIRLANNSPIRKKFIQEGKQVIKKYRNEAITSSDFTPRSDSSRYNVTWSSIQTMKPSFYSRIPKPIVIRLHKSDNPVKRLAEKVAGRCAAFSLKAEEDTFNQILETAVEDRLLPGLGCARVTYEAEFEEVQDPETGELIKVPTNEKASTKYIYWQDILYNHARIWNTDIEWVAIKHVLSRKEIKKQFDTEKFQPSKLISCNYTDKSVDRVLQDDEEKDLHKKSEVYEIWCKESKKVYWVSEGLKDRFLKVETDPLMLDNFFPVARPLMATCTSDTLIPIADFRITKGIVEDLDATYSRISALVDVVRFVGLHDASVSGDVIKMRGLPDGQTQPVRSWAAFAEKGGIKGCMDFFPIEKVVEVIRQLAEYGQGLLGQYYEITGIPDIIRGSSSPSESATAQQFKGQFATIRIADKQADVQRFCRDIIAMKAEIIFELFSDESISMMSDYSDMSQEEQALFPQALQLLRNDRSREFVMDVETDSTLALDENAEKAARLEFLSSLGQFFQNAMGIMQIMPEANELAWESVKFGVGAFRQGRELEGLLDTTIKKNKERIEQEQMMAQQQAEAQANQPPPRDPAEIKAEADMMIAQFKADLEAQTKQQKAQLDADIQMQKMDIEAEKAAQKTAIDTAIAKQTMAIKEMEAKQDALLKRYKTDMDIQIEAEKIKKDLMGMVANAGNSEQLRAMQELGLVKKTSSKKRVRVVRDEAGEIAGIESEEVQ